MRHSRPLATLAFARLRRAGAGTFVFAGIAGLAGIAGIAACAETLRVAGANPAAAEAHADQLFDAIATRFTQVEFAPKYDLARVRLTQGALTPSRVFDDTTVWSLRPTSDTRMLLISGALVDGHYRLETRSTLTPAIRPGETRHSVTLQQLAPSVYRWDTRVDMAIGTISSDEMTALITALFASAQNRSEHDLRDDYHVAFPRAAAAFGRGFAVDSLRTVSGALGTTSVTITMGFHPETMRTAYPALASYLDKYLGPAKYRFALGDRNGAPLLDVAGRNRQMTIRYRVQQGKLVSLFGPPKPWPDTMQLASDVSLKVKMFRVGFHNLLTDFVLSDNRRERALTIVAQREPQWDLPFVTERLIRSPLHRPFEGQGSMMRFAVLDSAGVQTMFSRRARLDVQESTIARFIGSLASHMIGDIDDRVEREEHRFLRDAFVALESDVRALGPRWRAAADVGAESRADQK